MPFSSFVSYFGAAVCLMRAAGLFFLKPDVSVWVDLGLLLVLTLGIVLLQTRRYATQTLVLMVLLIALIGGAAQMINARCQFPFGMLVYAEKAGPTPGKLIPLFVPLIWVACILTARDVSRLILRPKRKTPTYGMSLFWTTVGCSIVFAAGLDAFGHSLLQYWYWTENDGLRPIDSASLLYYPGWLMTTMLILVFTTGLMLKRIPARSQSDLTPLVLWGAMALLFLAAALVKGRWITAGIVLVTNILLVRLALRGAAFKLPLPMAVAPPDVRPSSSRAIRPQQQSSTKPSAEEAGKSGNPAAPTR